MKINYLKYNKYKIALYTTLIIGFIVRILGIAYFPNALNIDEASSGYEAFSILNYGIDRNGNFLPVFLESWGSGQNPLYTYIMIPFVKILGLNVFSIRIPMAIVGCISLIIMYKTLYYIKDKKFALIGLIFFTITPWHIMKSRWGLESNIFPDICLWGIFFIIKYIKTKKIKNIYFFAILLGISSYSYGTSYFFLPIFILITFIFLLIKKEIKIKHALGAMFTIFFISMPIIMFILINTFHLQPIKFIFTIPVLQENRYEEISNLFSDNFINSSINNFKQSIIILIKQNDNLLWNAYHIYGLTYTISLPFTIIGLFNNFKSRKNEKWIINFWFIVAFLMLFVVNPNINRINIIIMPIIYYTIVGIEYILNRIQISKVFIPIVYICLFISFVITYFNTNWDNYYTFNSNLKNVIQYVDKIDTDKIYFEYSFKEPYIYVCFYTKQNTKEFVNTVRYKNNIKTFESVESFGRYYFYIPKSIEKNAIYVIKSKNIQKYNFDSNSKKINIDDFTIIYN